MHDYMMHDANVPSGLQPRTACHRFQSDCRSCVTDLVLYQSGGQTGHLGLAMPEPSAAEQVSMQFLGRRLIISCCLRPQHA